MSRRAAVAWSVAGLLAVAAMLGGCGCYSDETNFECLARSVGGGIRPMSPGAGPKSEPTAARGFSAKSAQLVTEPNTVTMAAPAGVAAPNFGEVRAPLDLIPPFRAESTVGLCDPAFYPAPTAVFGFSVIERSGAGRAFSAECSRVGGITATASFGTPLPHAFAGAERVDLALEHDGTDLIAFARNHGGDGVWIEISRAAVAATGPFIPQVGARNFEPGQMVSFYSLRIPVNAPYGPGQATPQHLAVRALGEALNALADGTDELLSETPDIAAATLRIQAANQRVADAVAALDASADPGKKDPNAKKRKKARKAALKAAKSVTKALSSLDPSGAGETEKVFQRAGAAAVSLAQAADAILPDDLRAAIGGRTLKSFLAGR